MIWSYLRSDTKSFTLEVLPINDPPELDFIGSETIDEDTDLELNLSANDIDGDNLTYSASVDANADISINENILIISPYDNYYGDISVTVNVSDGELLDSQIFILTVLSVNDTPILEDIADLSVEEDETFEYNLEANDIDGDSLIFVATSDNSSTISINENELTLAPPNNFNGNIEVVVTVYDNGSSDTKSFTPVVLSKLESWIITGILSLVN